MNANQRLWTTRRHSTRDLRKLARIRKVQLAFDRQRQASAAVIDGCDEVLGGTKSKGAMADGFDLVVHSFNGTVGDSMVGPRQDSIEVGAEHAHELLKGLQARTHGRTHPFLQVLLGPFGLLVKPKQLKGFFEVVSADDGRVPADQCRKPVSLIAGEIPRILQQQPTGSFEGRSFLGSELAP